MLDTDLAYLAGVLDSDGFISIQRTTKNCHRGAFRWTATYFQARVGIAGTRREPHDFAAARFGGSIHAHTPKNPADRVQFQWVASGRMAAAVILAVRPFLLIKGEQADLTLELQALVQRQFAEIKATQRPPYRVPPEMAAERDRLFVAVRALNQDRQAASRAELTPAAILAELSGPNSEQLFVTHDQAAVAAGKDA